MAKLERPWQDYKGQWALPNVPQELPQYGTLTHVGGEEQLPPGAQFEGFFLEGPKLKGENSVALGKAPQREADSQTVSQSVSQASSQSGSQSGKQAGRQAASNTQFGFFQWQTTSTNSGTRWLMWTNISPVVEHWLNNWTGAG